MASATWIVPDRRHRWSPRAHAVQSVDGSLSLHAAVRTAREAEQYRLQVTVLLGYEPVSARITVWNADRTTRLETETATGLAMVTDEAAAAIDIELPVRTVPIGRWAEVETVVELAPNDRFDSADADVRRWIVHAGPEPPEPRTCVLVEGEKRTALHDEMKASGVSGGFLVPASATDRWPTDPSSAPITSLRAAVQVEKGEENAVVILADGRPVGPVSFVRGSRRGGVAPLGEVEPPPTGPVMLVTWTKPFSFPGGATNFRSSNVVWPRGP